ncbi:hypothetical protein GMES_3956 [Paraglaciecola mesophila KMM 241]|uniref:Uncharacterized protein n=1 Tax=Paraglaciecola mesophila KMM 241 TaxID=1128912 RepID=K6Y069_9ALTE|nr:hypothetical protein GMES_3956 [Paraglaciecola mesophila KMM 241]
MYKKDAINYQFFCADKAHFASFCTLFGIAYAIVTPAVLFEYFKARLAFYHLVIKIAKSSRINGANTVS